MSTNDRKMDTTHSGMNYSGIKIISGPGILEQERELGIGFNVLYIINLDACLPYTVKWSNIHKEFPEALVVMRDANSEITWHLKTVLACASKWNIR
ncbi:hypothetical protein TNCV_2686171 [Trichonephila clavipes]|nr:hypothetical protein TNCV_2686171 [Trichonephila clavipes]